MPRTRTVYIINGNIEYQDMFERFGWEVTANFNEAELIQFTGGEDVSPILYNESQHRKTQCNIIRDKREMYFFHLARKKRIPMAGICRGGQFLNVMCGGWLWQDVDGHESGLHDVIDINGEVYKATSSHHQLMRVNEGHCKIIAVAGESTYWESCRKVVGEQTIMKKKGHTDDIEAVYYPIENCLCVQYHPEYSGFNNLQQIYFDYIEDYIFCRNSRDKRKVM